MASTEQDRQDAPPVAKRLAGVTSSHRRFAATSIVILAVATAAVVAGTARAAAPHNDRFDEARPVAVVPASLPYSTQDASREAEEPTAAARSVWHQFAPAAAGTYTAQASSSGRAALRVAKAGCGATIDQLVSSGAAIAPAPGVPAVVSFSAEPGETIWLAIDGATPADAPSGVLTVDGPSSAMLVCGTPVTCHAKSFGTSGDDSPAFSGPASYDGLAGADKLGTNSSSDCLFGSDGNDWIGGGSESDDVVGGAGADELGGGSESDRIIGGLGTDTFTGGSGADILDAADGVAEEVGCGGDRDAVAADDVDVLTACEDRTVIDQQSPSISGVTHDPGVAEGWHRGGTFSATVVAADPDTGVREIRLTKETPSGDTTDARTFDCGLPLKDGLCPRSATAMFSYDAAALAEGSAVKVSVRSADSVGRVSTPLNWFLRIDRTAPAAVSEITGEHNPATRQLHVSWTAASDPVLGDGTLGSGIAAHRYQYRVSGGSWVTGETGGFEDFLVPEVDAGDIVEVEVTPLDAAGNVGPTGAALLTAVAPSTWDCSDQPVGAYPSHCVQGLELPADATDEPANVTLESAEDGTSAFSAASASGRYRVRVRTQIGEPYSNPFDRWTTVRSSPNAWVIGQARDGDIIDVDFAGTSQQSNGVNVRWYRGVLPDFNGGPNRNGCGFVLNRNVNDIDIGDIGTCAGYAMNIGSYSSSTNCPDDDEDAGGHRCDHGTAVFLQHDTRICANVGLNSQGNTTGCVVGGENYKGQLHAGDCFEWRYITNDGGDKQRQYVMGKIRGRPNAEASWVFIRRTALNARNSRLPTIRSDRDQSCDDSPGP